MVKLINGYYLSVDARCYSVGKLAEKPDKNGRPVLNAEAFCTTPTSAILWLKERLRREAVSRMNGEFDDFIEAIKKSDEKIVKLFERTAISDGSGRSASKKKKKLMHIQANTANKP